MLGRMRVVRLRLRRQPPTFPTVVYDTVSWMVIDEAPGRPAR